MGGIRTIGLPSGHPEFELTAEVVRVDIPMGEKPLKYRVGLKFLEILPEDHERLTAFLKMISS